MSFHNLILPPRRDFQIESTAHMHALRKSAVIAKPGAGKTRIICDAINEEYDISNNIEVMGPVLILCSGPALNTWKYQMPYWCDFDPNLVAIVDGTKPQRLLVWADALRLKLGVYVCNYAVFLADYEAISSVKWEVILADEYQRTMRGHTTKTFQSFRKLTRHTPNMFLGTGSAMRGTPNTMWTLFSLVQPTLFASYWTFVDRFCQVVKTEFSSMILGAKNIPELQGIIAEYLAFVPHKVVLDQMPKGFRSSIFARMTKEQEKIYKNLEEDLIALLDTGGLVVAQTKMTVVLRLKQLLCCPKLLDPDLGMGGGFEAIYDKIQDQENPHCIIFVPFRAACDYVRAELIARGHHNVFILRGSMGHVEQKEAIDGFNATKGIVVCTIQYAESFELISTQNSYFLGYAYTVDENEQAEGRTQRISSTYDKVHWQYVVYPGTIDDHYMAELGQDFIRQAQVFDTPSKAVKLLSQDKTPTPNWVLE